MNFRSFLFVCTSYKATFLNWSDNTWRHLRLQILSPFLPSSAIPATYFPCRMSVQTWQPTQSRACLRREHACLHETVFWKILHVFRPLCPIVSVCVCVCVCVCVHRRVVTYSGHFLLRYSTTFLLTYLHSLQHPLLLVLSLSLLWSFFSLCQKITPYIRLTIGSPGQRRVSRLVISHIFKSSALDWTKNKINIKFKLTLSTPWSREREWTYTSTYS
jgi:hypothetical protein